MTTDIPVAITTPRGSVIDALLLWIFLLPDPVTRADAQETSADARARETEQKMTDDERFSLVISVIGGLP